jgi:hypothetical protein
MDCLAGKPWPFIYWGMSMKDITRAIILCILLSCNILQPGFKVFADQAIAVPVFRYATPQLWPYLRMGLNYLESPSPLSRPEDVSPAYVHPDGQGFGPFGFSPAAYEDVQRVYPYFRQYEWQDVLGSPFLYDLANRAFADWLLGNLQEEIPQGAVNWQIFDVLQKAWNLGLSGYKKGKSVVASRIRRAEEFVNSVRSDPA